MAEVGQKTKKYESVRIRPEVKEQLEELQANHILINKRKATEVDLVSEAVSAFCKKEKRKLGIV